MNVSQLVGEDKPVQTRRAQPSIEGTDNAHAYNAWQDNATHGLTNGFLNHSPQRVHTIGGQSGSPRSPDSSTLAPKHVTFEYLLPEAPQQRARLPMRVNIYPHDATESIITTVKNFYGLYDGNGVSFEDKDGCTLIAQYENFQDQMTVYVRVAEGAGSSSGTPRTSMSPRRPRLGSAFEMLPPGFMQAQNISRPSSRAAYNRSTSPQNNRGRRSASVSTMTKSRSRPAVKGRTGSAHNSFNELNGELAQDCSDSDGGNGSVSSSRRGKDGVVVTADISVDNIVEGGRRKRTKFLSSELPLFQPSQVPMPTSVSSISPQRRNVSNNGASPYQLSNQQTFSYTQPLPSPQSYGHSDLSHLGNTYAASNAPAFNNNRALRQRPVQYAPPRYAGAGPAVLPTPDPTIGSVISDEDVALQLMRLGDMSNYSTHGRTSTSTVDDALSGKAEVSDESDGSVMEGVEFPTRHAGYASDEYSGEEYEDRQDNSFKGEGDGIMPGNMGQNRRASSKSKSVNGNKVRSNTWLVKKTSKIRVKVKGEHGPNTPMSPTSLPTQSRKTSNASITQFGLDEDDLSTKPRCQRCRKSKKGCDRQRPCGRCKDAQIGIEGCISEDEGNGRKGRYGRHMGVPVKKGEDGLPIETQQSPVPSHHAHTHAHTSMAPPPFMGMNGNKKRKR